MRGAIAEYRETVERGLKAIVCFLARAWNIPRATLQRRISGDITGTDHASGRKPILKVRKKQGKKNSREDKDPCKVCHTLFGDPSYPTATQDWVCCDHCSAWFHERCGEENGIFYLPRMFLKNLHINHTTRTHTLTLMRTHTHTHEHTHAHTHTHTHTRTHAHTHTHFY